MSCRTSATRWRLPRMVPSLSAIESTSESMPQAPSPQARRARPPRVIFVGGTGRSGTHVVAKLVGRHRLYRYIPIECRFHVERGGYPDLLAGEVTSEQFVRRLRRH